MNNYDKNDIKSILNKNGFSTANIKNQAEKRKIESLLNNVSRDDMAKIDNVLSDKAAAEKLLNSPEAQELMKKLFGDK